MLENWTATLARELGVDIDVDIESVLDIARVAAHEVARPAAPITTFLVGYAAALRGGDAFRELADAAIALAEREGSADDAE